MIDDLNGLSGGLERFHLNWIEIYGCGVQLYKCVVYEVFGAERVGVQ